jgi:hypothetical protein
VLFANLIKSPGLKTEIKFVPPAPVTVVLDELIVIVPVALADS